MKSTIKLSTDKAVSIEANRLGSINFQIARSGANLVFECLSPMQCAAIIFGLEAAIEEVDKQNTQILQAMHIQAQDAANAKVIGEALFNDMQARGAA